MEIKELDCRGLSCPLPVLRATRALRDLQAGARLRVLATDSNAPADFRAMCEVTAHTLEESARDGDVFTIVVRRGADDA